jgi:hypothetical protein
VNISPRSVLSSAPKLSRGGKRRIDHAKKHSPRAKGSKINRGLIIRLSADKRVVWKDYLALAIRLLPICFLSVAGFANPNRGTHRGRAPSSQLL